MFNLRPNMFLFGRPIVNLNLNMCLFEGSMFHLSPNIHAWKSCNVQSKSEYFPLCRCIVNRFPNMCLFCLGGSVIFNLSQNMCVVFSFVYFRVPIVVATLSDMLKPILVQMKPFTLSDVQS